MMIKTHKSLEALGGKTLHKVELGNHLAVGIGDASPFVRTEGPSSRMGPPEDANGSVFVVPNEDGSNDCG